MRDWSVFARCLTPARDSANTRRFVTGLLAEGVFVSIVIRAARNLSGHVVNRIPFEIEEIKRELTAVPGPARRQGYSSRVIFTLAVNSSRLGVEIVSKMVDPVCEAARSSPKSPDSNLCRRWATAPELIISGSIAMPLGVTEVEHCPVR